MKTQYAPTENINISRLSFDEDRYTTRVAKCCDEVLKTTPFENRINMAPIRTIKRIAKKHNVNPDRIDKIINYQIRRENE